MLLFDPSVSFALLLVAAITAYFFVTRRKPPKSPIPLDNQSIVLPDGERVSHFAKDGNLTKYAFEGTTTLYETFQRGKRVSNDGPCLGTRVSATGPYEWLSYSQVEERSVAFGAGLCKLGIDPGQSSFIGIYGPNCTEWVIAEQSCNAYSRVVVPLYDTLGREAVIHIMNEATIQCVVCNSQKVQNLTSLKESCPQLRAVIVFDETISEEDTKCAKESNIEIYTMKQVEEEGCTNPVTLQPATPADLATICYTSGTTGLPKGVMLTNENIVSNASAVYIHINSFMAMDHHQVHISYLPLAHIMERTAEALLFMVGARVGFFSGDVKTLLNDINELKPTLFMSVPRLLNKMYDKVIAGVSSSKAKKWLFDMAFKAKLAEVQRGIIRNDSFWDMLIFKKVQKSLGGRVQTIVSGSAPISGRVLNFLRVAFGCNVIEGYGQTETGAGATFSVAMDTRVGHVGPVLPCLMVKLRDVPEMNYFAANNEGEVCFKGPNVTQGYYKNPEKTAELFDEDGWARSGDVGRWLPNGTLKIIDRVKHIFKLSQGEYIAPEKVENVCTRSLYISQMFLFGDSLKSCCVAVVVPDEEVLMNWASANGRKGVSIEDLCHDKEVKKIVFDDIVSVARRDKLNSLEIPKAIKICAEPFSVDNGLLTPTFKVKRPQLKTKFMDDILEMYSKLPA